MVHVLRALRRQEKGQTLFYRALAADAELAGMAELAERFNELHADEQHHLSRLTARLLELGEEVDDLTDFPRPTPVFDEWEAEARKREEGEIAAYEAALTDMEDEATREIFVEILESERQHAQHLGGKWMPA